MPKAIRAIVLGVSALVVVFLTYFAVTSPSPATISPLLSATSLLLTAIALITKDALGEQNPAPPQNAVALSEQLSKDVRQIRTTVAEHAERRRTPSAGWFVAAIITLGYILSRRRR